MKTTTTDEPAGAQSSVLDNYDTQKLRKEVMQNVRVLGSRGSDTDEKDTFDKAADLVASRYQTNRGVLSWLAHRTDFMKAREKTQSQYVRDALKEASEPLLPGFGVGAPFPICLLIDGEVVNQGDRRLTFKVWMEQLAIEIGVFTKEIEALEFRADQLRAGVEQVNAVLESCSLIAEEARKQTGLGPEDLIYNEKTKTLVPRPRA